MGALILLSGIFVSRYRSEHGLMAPADLRIEQHAAIRVAPGSPADAAGIFALLPFKVTNKGGRAATLVKIDSDQLPVFRRVANDKALGDEGFTVQFALAEGAAPTDRAQLSQVRAQTTRPFALPIFINEPVDSGQKRAFYVALKVSARDNLPLQEATFFFSCKLVFSDGTIHRVAQAFGPHSDSIPAVR